MNVWQPMMYIPYLYDLYLPFVLLHSKSDHKYFAPTESLIICVYTCWDEKIQGEENGKERKETEENGKEGLTWGIGREEGMGATRGVRQFWAHLATCLLCQVELYTSLR